MYDILQLNDMLLPELLDIAEQLNITAAKKLDKQGLIYKILDGQAVQASETKDDPKKKNARPRKPVTLKTANGTEEAEVMQEAPKAEKAAPAPKKGPVRKPRAEAAPEQVQPQSSQPTDNQDTNTESNNQEGESAQPGENNAAPDAPQHQYPRQQQRKEPAFNIEFEGVILGEGVLEMMPDGYGFLRSSDYNYL